MLDLEAICLVLFVIKGVQLVDSDLMEAVEVRPPFPAAAKIIVQECVSTLLAQFGGNIESTQSQHVDTVAGDSAECGGNRLNNTCMDAGALGSSDVDTHTGAAEDHCTLKFLLGDHGAGA